MNLEISTEEFQEILPNICDQNNLYDHKGWNKDNPLWGHCVLVSLLAQEVFGGNLLNANLDKNLFPDLRNHMWNRLPYGKDYDFTEEQFQGKKPKNMEEKIIGRSIVLSWPQAEERYNFFRYRFTHFLDKLG